MKYKLRPGEKVFQHRTADEPPTGRLDPWGGISQGAMVDPRSKAIQERLEADSRWPGISDYLGPCRVMVGQEVNGRKIAMVACKDGRTYEITPMDQESDISIARRLLAEVERARHWTKMDRLERYLRYGPEAIRTYA